MGRVKVRKLLGSDKDILTGKAKAVHASKTQALHIVCVSLAHTNYEGSSAVTIRV